MGLSLEQKELGKDKGEKHTSEEPYAEGEGNGPAKGLLVPGLIFRLWKRTQQPRLDKVGKAERPNLELASNNQHVHSYSDKATQAWGGGACDRDSGWCVVCQTCPRHGSLTPSTPSKDARQPGPQGCGRSPK